MPRLIDYKGELAVDFGWITNWFLPRQERALTVGRGIHAADWQRVIDAEIEFTGDVGKVWLIGATYPIWIDTTSWEHVQEIRPVKKPRRGRDYDWEWWCGRWRKRWL